jgi:hypothetical protein
VQDTRCFAMHHVYTFTSVCSIALSDRASSSGTRIRSLPHVQWFGRIFSILNAQQQELQLVNLVTVHVQARLSAADAVCRPSTVADTPADKQQTIKNMACCMCREDCTAAALCLQAIGQYIHCEHYAILPAPLGTAPRTPSSGPCSRSLSCRDPLPPPG